MKLPPCTLIGMGRLAIRMGRVLDEPWKHGSPALCRFYQKRSDDTHNAIDGYALLCRGLEQYGAIHILKQKSARTAFKRPLMKVFNIEAVQFQARKPCGR